MKEKELIQKKPMNKDIKIFLIVCAVLALGIAIALIYFLTPKAVTVATIDKSSVSSYDFQYYLSQNVADALQYKTDTSMENETYLNSTYGEGTLLDAIKQQTLVQVIQIKLLLQKANEEGFKLSGKELEAEWKAFENTLQQNAISSEMSIKDLTKAALGVSLAQTEKIYKEYILSQKYFDQRSADIIADKTKLTEYYQANKSDFDFATVSHILILCPQDADKALVAEKKRLAEDLLAKAKSGSNFATLAIENSEDPDAKETGGVYSIKQNGEMVPEFETWVFTHSVGDMGIIQTSYGFHVIKLDVIKNTFEAQKEYIEKNYKDNEYQKILDNLLNSDQYKVDVKDAYNNF